MHDFITSYINHLENINSLSSADLPNAVIRLHPTEKRSHLLIPLPISSEQSLLGSCQTQGGEFTFQDPNSNFHL